MTAAMEVGGNQSGNQNHVKPKREISLQEIRKHNTKDDCWIIVHDSVYDLSKWVKFHPGGQLPILGVAGRDATDLFDAFHQEWITQKKLPHFLIGTVKMEDRVENKVLTAFREMRKEIEDEGLMQTNYSWYYTKAVWYATLFVFSLYCLFGFDSAVAHFTSAVAMGIFWQQLAFAGHDLCHMAVTHDRTTDTLIAVVVSTLFGVSSNWWKRTHNVHHVVTNSVESDPDIQHLPVFAVTEKYFKSVYSKYHERVLPFDRISRLIVSYQHLLYYPVMAVARVNLYVQSFILHAKCSDPMLFKEVDLGAMFVFWTWFTMLMNYVAGYSWQRAAMYFFVSHAVAALLHIQITISHFAMPCYEEKPGEEVEYNFVEVQTEHSMDVDCSPYMDWFHGGLQFQVVHHLLPRVPRHNLRYVRDKYVLPFCEKWDVKYHSHSFVEANRIVLSCLREAGLKARNVPNAQLHPFFVAGFKAEG